MSATLARICRHPVKSLGEEVIDAVTVEAGQHMPWDRVWAVCHGASTFDATNPEWVQARNFVTQTMVPNLARITARFDEAAGVLELEHPDAEPISLDPDANPQALCEWLLPLAQHQRPGPYRMARLPAGALTDFTDTHIAINSIRGLAMLEDAAGTTLHKGRFRGNLWVDGLAPWEEFDWIGREITVGEARLKVTERVTRCNATTANPATGMRDVPVTQILEDRWGHMDFGVYAQIVGGGTMRTGDTVSVV